MREVRRSDEAGVVFIPMITGRPLALVPRVWAVNIWCCVLSEDSQIKDGERFGRAAITHFIRSENSFEHALAWLSEAEGHKEEVEFFVGIPATKTPHPNRKRRLSCFSFSHSACRQPLSLSSMFYKKIVTKWSWEDINHWGPKAWQMSYFLWAETGPVLPHGRPPPLGFVVWQLSLMSKLRFSNYCFPSITDVYLSSPQRSYGDTQGTIREMRVHQFNWKQICRDVFFRIRTRSS